MAGSLGRTQHDLPVWTPEEAAAIAARIYDARARWLCVVRAAAVMPRAKKRPKLRSNLVAEWPAAARGQTVYCDDVALAAHATHATPPARSALPGASHVARATAAAVSHRRSTGKPLPPQHHYTPSPSPQTQPIPR